MSTRDAKSRPCPTCHGEGTLWFDEIPLDGDFIPAGLCECDVCEGTGQLPASPDDVRQSPPAPRTDANTM